MFNKVLFSLGEILIPSVVETPPSPSIKKSRSFTSSIEIVLRSPRSPVTSHDSTDGEEGSHVEDGEQVVNSVDKSECNEVEGTQLTPAGPQVTETVVLRKKSGENLTRRTKHHGKSKSACERSPSEEDAEELNSRHTKSLSDPIKKADEKRGRRKLMEYQKWQKYGRRGKPPGDLKISE